MIYRIWGVEAVLAAANVSTANQKMISKSLMPFHFPG
jgi:hypothetical protein